MLVQSSGDGAVDGWRCRKIGGLHGLCVRLQQRFQFLPLRAGWIRGVEVEIVNALAETRPDVLIEGFGQVVFQGAAQPGPELCGIHGAAAGADDARADRQLVITIAVIQRR